MSIVTVTVVLKLVRQTEAAECGGHEEQDAERRSPGRGAGRVRELAGGWTFEERTGAAPGQREEDGGGRIRAAYRINGESLVNSAVKSIKDAPCGF